MGRMSKSRVTPDDFQIIYDRFQTSISRYDCGQHCAPLNGGEPVCCTTRDAIPVVDKAEFALLRGRTDLWRRFKPYDAASRKIVDELHSTCAAIECKGARHCERDNRTLACRAFPFFPFITRAGELIGLGYYWTFEDRCWVLSNLKIVERGFVRDFIAAYEYLFEKDPEEFETMKNYSATMRRTFSRLGRPIPIIARAGGYLKIMPKTGEIRPAHVEEFKAHGPYKSSAAYARAVKEAQRSN